MLYMLKCGTSPERVGGERGERGQRGRAGGEAEAVRVVVGLVVAQLLQRVHELAPLVVPRLRHALRTPHTCISCHPFICAMHVIYY